MKPIIFYSPDPDSGGGSDAAKTDSTKLIPTDTVFVSTDGGTTDEAFPVPGKEYDFCVDVSNLSELPSGAFYVRFTLRDDSGSSENKTFDFNQDAGLDARQSVQAVVHFGQFIEQDVDYTLSACVYSPSAPETPINCAGTFSFNPHSNPRNIDDSTSISDDSTDDNNQN